MAPVCALDIGTTRIKALLLSEALLPGPPMAAPSVLRALGPDAAEVDAEALWAQTTAVLRAVAADAGEVEALAISNQRATVFLVDDEGHPLTPGLSWQDRRGSRALSAWLEVVGRAGFVQTTGLVPSTLWSLAKILWWREQGLLGGARVATVQDWILHRLGAREWVLDQANASLTGLLNIRSLTWDADLVRDAGLSPSQLPELARSGVRAGELSTEAAQATGLAAGLPLVVGGGDQQCAALGAGALETGDASVSLGTAAVVDVPGDHVIIDPEERLVSVAHVLPGRWLLEGLENTYGGAHQWGRELLGSDLTALAAGIEPGSGGLIFLPYLAGSGAPGYEPEARGSLLGLALSHGRGEVARAILEGTTVEIVRILGAVRDFAAVRRLIVGGGATASPLLLQMLADLAGVPVAIAPFAETSLVGAGVLAWVGAGRWPDGLEARAALPPPVRTVLPETARATAYRALYERYEEALARLGQVGVPAPRMEVAGG